MKRVITSAFAVVLLCLLSTGIIIYSHGQMTARGEDVTVTETTLFGEKSAAEGIEINIATAVSDITSAVSGLAWDLTYDPAPTVRTKADFQYDTSIYTHTDRTEPAVYLSELHSGRDVWDKSYTLNFEHDLETGSLPYIPDETTLQLLQNAVAEAPAGEKFTKKLPMSDLYEYFPVTLTYQRPSNEDNQTIHAADFFKLAVPDQTVTARVTKDKDEKVSKASLDWGQSFLMSADLVDDENCYIALTGTMDKNANLLTKPEGGHPVLCRIPIIGTSKKNAKLYINQGEISYALPKDARVLAMENSWDNKTLLLLTEENGSYCLTSVSKETLQITERNVLCPAPDYTYFGYDTTLRLLVGKDFALLLRRNGDFYFLEYKDTAYELSISGNLLQFSDPPEMEALSKVCADFDGERLAIIMKSPYDYHDYITGIDLQVFDRTGLLYAARYKNSLDDLVASPPKDSFLTYDLQLKAVTFAQKKEASK